MPASVDFDIRYALPADLRVVQRDATTIQIGTEQPRRMMLIDAPAGTTDVLARLNGAMSAGEAVAKSGGDPLVWRALLSSMLAAGLLVRAPHEHRGPPHLIGERLALIHQHGTAVADRLLGARSDALVVLHGEGPVAETTAALLAAAGVGHVHQHPPGRRGGDGPMGPTFGPAVGGAAGPVAGAAWRAAPGVRVHRPAPQVPPSAVVLADRTLPDLSRAAELVTSLIPHLAVRVTQARVVVGPLVLPGRSACLNCVERRRIDADPGWPSVAAALRKHPVHPATLAVQFAAELAAGQVLDLLDGLHRPLAVNATLERHTGALQVRRRSWLPHPECGCRLLSGQL